MKDQEPMSKDQTPMTKFQVPGSKFPAAVNGLHSISVHVGNLTPREAVFLGGVVGLFCDPRGARARELLAAGLLQISMLPNGRAVWGPVVGEN